MVTRRICTTQLVILLCLLLWSPAQAQTPTPVPTVTPTPYIEPPPTDFEYTLINTYEFVTRGRDIYQIQGIQPGYLYMVQYAGEGAVYHLGFSGGAEPRCQPNTYRYTGRVGPNHVFLAANLTNIEDTSYTISACIDYAVPRNGRLQINLYRVDNVATTISNSPEFFSVVGPLGLTTNEDRTHDFTVSVVPYRLDYVVPFLYKSDPDSGTADDVIVDIATQDVIIDAKAIVTGPDGYEEEFHGNRSLIIEEPGDYNVRLEYNGGAGIYGDGSLHYNLSGQRDHDAEPPNANLSTIPHRTPNRSWLSSVLTQWG